MKRDQIVLGDNYILSGDDVGKSRPNANALIVGISGCGKSTSVILPTVARSEHSNPILNYAKEHDAYAMAQFLKHKGYNVNILNLIDTEKSTISFDPLMYLTCREDIESLSASIVDATIKRTVDDYWQAKAKPLLSALIYASLMNEGEDADMEYVLKMFDNMIPRENGGSVQTPLDDMFLRLKVKVPDCYAAREYYNWQSLPFKTASCVRDTLAASLSTVFPEAIRKNMREKPQLDVEKFVADKEAVIVITSAIEPSQHYYANLFYRNTERELLRYANNCPGGELPREVRYIYDDFACTAPISGFANDISLFRAAGISAILLLQSEQQLEAIYKDEAPIIRQNCPVYVYFPGGFDDKSCEIVSKRMQLPYDEILYAPMGKIYIMQSGRKPVHIPRYDTLNSCEYHEYQTAIHEDSEKG